MVLVACLGVSAPARAAVVSPDAPDSGLITVGLRSVGTSTVVSVPIHRNAPWIVPLPAGAKNVRLVDAAQLTALEARTAPRYFHVTRPAACDPTRPHRPLLGSLVYQVPLAGGKGSAQRIGAGAAEQARRLAARIEDLGDRAVA